MTYDQARTGEPLVAAPPLRPATADPAPKLFHLTEWEQRRGVSLPGSTARLLRQAYSPQIAVAPSWEDRSLYDLEVHGYVGAISLPDAHLLLRPKVPLNTVVHMLATVDSLPELADETNLFAETDLTNLMARWFLDLATPLVEWHLLRRYRAVEEDSLFVRGQIQVAPSTLNQLV